MPPARAPNGGLAGTSWELVSLDGNTQVGAAIGGQAVTLMFSSDTEAGGSGGCNGFGGNYQANATTGSISFSELVSTLIACEEPIMSVEIAYFEALNAAQSYSISGTQLTISGGGTSVFERQ
ncbi:MAG: META domain-containing protein [Anaerolineales bacterium]